MVDFCLLSKAVVDGDYNKTHQLTASALDSGAKPQDIIDQGLQPAMGVVGKKFSSGEYFLPDILIAARAMTNAMDVLKPLLTQTSAATLGKVVLGTVKGDVHDIGKNLVSMLLKGAGFEIIDLGVDMPDERFVEAAREIKPDILGLSALLTTTMPSLGTVIKKLEAAGLRSDVKVIVGGASVTQEYANLVGADAYAHDAGVALEICKKLIKNEAV